MLTRRELLQNAAGGFGTIALAGLFAEIQAAEGPRGLVDPLAPKPGHFPPKARRVIFMFMTGGVSHVETFDPKPKLVRDAGQTVSIDNWQGRPGNYTFYLKKPHFDFHHSGRSGLEISDLFPHVRDVADDLCVIRSMYT